MTEKGIFRRRILEWALGSWAANVALPLFAALVLFSIQFLYPWDSRSWERFFRSVGIGTLLIAAIKLWSTRRVMFAGLQDVTEARQLRDVRWTRDFLLAFAAVTT